MSSSPADSTHAADFNPVHTGQNLRRHKRIARKAKFTFFPLDEWGDKSYDAESVDISSGGLSFVTDRSVKKGSLIILKLGIIDVLESDERVENVAQDNVGKIIAAAKVLRKRTLPDGRYRVAVKFDFETHIEGSKEDLKIIFAQAE
jgi:hypothetical protein